MIPVETTPGMGEGSVKGECWILERVNSSVIYFIWYKNFCKQHNVPPTQHNNLKKESDFYSFWNAQEKNYLGIMMHSSGCGMITQVTYPKSRTVKL